MEDGLLRLGDHGDGARQNGDQLKQNVLERMACLDPWELCNEAKVEKCRATRDLRSCGRTVHNLLTSCGHACLCVECSQRCDICPICRTPIARREPVLRLRLYDECVEAGLLPSVQSEDFRERDGPYWTLDAFRLCSFFDIALDNNLVCLICHYVTDVCMNEDAISSDPVISMLLDGAVLKEWCKRTLVVTVRKLRDIYHSRPSKSKGDMLDTHARRLQGLTYVLETLEAPLNLLSASLLELQQLLESVRLVSQHLEVMAWCIKQRFLENIQSCYSSIADWTSAFQERKRAANDRVYVGKPGVKPLGTLFIEDALSIGLGRDEAESYHRGESSNIMLDVGLLRHGNPTDDYPPESTRAAVDFLFLEGSPDLFFAKKAIFLYYLFDRHWTLPEHDWGHIVEDYVLTFSIPRQSMLESLVFYLLDNSSDVALKEACRWLPEIVGSNVHPKIATVLLERQKVDTALSVLQSTGQLSQSLFNSLSGSTVRVSQQKFNVAALPAAVTVVRVLLECGCLLSEAYLYQQSHCKAIKADVKQSDEESSRDWLEEMEVLVGEICWYCIRKNCVGKMLELPWKASEEKTLRNILLDQTVQNPASSAGSLLTVFYLQRCRFSEAYSVHKNLCHLEQQFISESSDIGASAQVQRICEQRTKLIEKSLELLPEVERERILSGDAQQENSLEDDIDITPSRFVEERPHIEELSVSSTNLLMNNRKQITTPADLSLPSPRNGRPTPTPKNNSLIKSPLFTAANDSLGISPLLGKRLRYEPGKKDRTQAMVVTW